MFVVVVVVVGFILSYDGNLRMFWTVFRSLIYNKRIGLDYQFLLESDLQTLHLGSVEVFHLFCFK